MLDVLATSEARQNGSLFVHTLRWHEEGDWPTDYLFRGVAEQPLRPPIPTLDDAVEVFAYNRVVRGLNDRCKPLRTLLRLLAVRKVDQHIDGADKLPRRIEDRCRIRGKRHTRPIRPLSNG